MPNFFRWSLCLSFYTRRLQMFKVQRLVDLSFLSAPQNVIGFHLASLTPPPKTVRPKANLQSTR